jgi:hypothetical protein
MDVVALEVTMHNSEIVRTRQGGTHLLEDVDSALHGHGAACKLSRQRGTDEVLHDQVQFTIVCLPNIVDVDDVRVVHSVGGSRFAEHPGTQMRLAAQVRSDELYGHDAIDEHVSCPIDDTHAAFAHARLESVATCNDLAKGRVMTGASAGVPRFLHDECLCQLEFEEGPVTDP